LEDPVPEYKLTFTHSPLALPDELVVIAPQRIYNPPGHTMPRAHIGMDYEAFANILLKSQLLALVGREGPDKYGKIDNDIPGRFSGGCFHETLTEFEGSQMPEAWSHNLAFMYHPKYPDIKVLGSGGCEGCPLPAFGWLAHPDDPDWRNVSVESGPVLYRLYNGIAWDIDGFELDYWARVQLISDDEIYLEAFTSPEEATEFTENRVRYIR
jgi:hypothetical protein